MKSDKLIDTIIRYIEQKGIITDESFLRRGQLFELFGVNLASVIKKMDKAGDRISNKNMLSLNTSTVETYPDKFVLGAGYKQGSTGLPDIMDS